MSHDSAVHLVTGDDDLLLQRALEGVLEQLRDDALDIELHDVSEIERLPEMRTASLFGGRLCLVLRGVEGVSGALKEELEDYLAAPDPEAVLVLVAQGTGRIRKIAKLAGEQGRVHTVALPKDWDRGGWQKIVTDEFARAGRKAEPAAVAAVLDHAGSDPSVIATRVAQVVAQTEAGRAVSLADVESAIEGHGRQSSFAFADAVADRDPARALTLLRGALDTGEEPLALLGALTFRFRQLSAVRAGLSPRDARASPSQYRRLQHTARENFGTGELGWCMDRLAQLDTDLKGNSELPAHLVLELGVIDLATRREVGSPWNPLAS